MKRDDEEMLTCGLKALAAEMESVAAPESVELKVLEAFRKQNLVTPIVAKRWNSRYWFAAAIAAMLLIAISVVAYRLNYRVDNDRKLAKQEQPQSSRELIVEPVKQEQVAGVQEPEQKSSAQAPKPRRVRHANHAEIATDFIPLSSMPAVSLQDGGQIVRVKLPRSALANFGLPVNMDRYNEKVKADVLIGVDGLAHAIRFVQ
jgi:hypothetical protein